MYGTRSPLMELAQYVASCFADGEWIGSVGGIGIDNIAAIIIIYAVSDDQPLWHRQFTSLLH